MKKKFAKIKNYKNANDTFKYHTDQYCKILADKYGKDKTQVKDYFSKFFDFLNSKGLITDAVKNRINKNIKTCEIERIKGIEKATEAYYTPLLNKITLRSKTNYNENNILVHEFIHLLTTEVTNGDNKKFSQIDKISKKSSNQIVKIGYSIEEYSTLLPNYSEYSTTLNKEEFIDLLENTVNFMYDSEYKFFNYYIDKTLDIKIDKIDKLVLNNKCSNIPDQLKIITDKQEINYTDKDKQKISKIVRDYVNKEFKSANRKNLLINLNNVLDINFDGKRFIIKGYSFDFTSPNMIDGISSANFTNYLNEGSTELLARMFNCHYQNKDLLLFNGYNLNTKYCELLYRIYGEEYLKTFFDLSFEELQNLMQLDDSEFDDFTYYIDQIFETTNENEIQQYHEAIMEQLIDCFTSKICESILENIEKYFNSREIEIAIENSILDFASSMYNGCCSTYNYLNKHESLYYLTDSYKILIEYLKNISRERERDEFCEQFNLNDEQCAKLSALKLPTDGIIANLYSDINFVSNNHYYFTKNNLSQINPLEYVTGKNLKIKNFYNQEYLRKKQKIRSVKFGNEDYQQYWLEKNANIRR